MSHELTRFSDRREVAILWFAFLGPLLAWKLQLMVNYVLVPYACWRGLGVLIDLASLLTFSVALAAGWVGWGRWKLAAEARERAGQPPGSPIDTEISRARFMAAAGMGLGAFSALLILAQWLPGLLLNPCWS
jgi:hypothetical protein